jgi:hypothetical protein
MWQWLYLLIKKLKINHNYNPKDLKWEKYYGDDGEIGAYITIVMEKNGHKLDRQFYIRNYEHPIPRFKNLLNELYYYNKPIGNTSLNLATTGWAIDQICQGNFEYACQQLTRR